MPASKWRNLKKSRKMPYYKNYIYSAPYTPENLQESEPIYTPTASEGSGEELKQLSSGVYITTRKSGDKSKFTFKQYAEGGDAPTLPAKKDTGNEAASDASSTASEKDMKPASTPVPVKKSSIPRLTPPQKKRQSTNDHDGSGGGGDCPKATPHKPESTESIDKISTEARRRSEPECDLVDEEEQTKRVQPCDVLDEVEQPSKAVQVQVPAPDKKDTFPLQTPLIVGICIQMCLIIILGFQVFSYRQTIEGLDTYQETLINNNNFMLQLMFGLEKHLKNNASQSLPGTYYDKVIETTFNGTSDGVIWTIDNSSSTHMQNMIGFWKTVAEYGQEHGPVGAVQLFCPAQPHFNIFSWIWNKLTFWW